MPDLSPQHEFVISFLNGNRTPGIKKTFGLKQPTYFSESKIFINFRPCYPFQKIPSKNAVLPFRHPSTVSSVSPVNQVTIHFSQRI